MSTPASVYLIGASHSRVVEEVFARIRTEVGRRPRVAVSIAGWSAPRGSAQAGAFIRSHLQEATIDRFTVDGEQDGDPEDAQGIVERADVIFLGGGDPVLSAGRLCAAGADRWLRDARSRGAVCVGMSAGSITLGAFWASWPDHEPDAPPTLIRCLGVVPDLVVDCHAEADHWEELRAVRHLVDALVPPPRVRFAGIGHDAAVIVAPDGALAWIGPTMLL